MSAPPAVADLPGPAVLVAATAAALAVALVAPLMPRPAALGTGAPRPRPSSRAAPVVLGGAATAAVLLGLPVRAVVLGVVLASAVWAGHGLVVRRRARAEAARTAERVRESCEALAADLRSGRPAGPALERACEAWPPLAPVAASYAVGADVPAALRALAGQPGCGDLRTVAAAWEVAHRTGHGLAGAVSRVADGVRSRQATRRVVTSELASARSTARLLAVLPVAALLMGTGAGGDPWRFLLTTGVGLACLAGGLALALAGLWWIEALADDVEAGP
ncbi:hypothetical protein GCM10009737_14140 [Nocardioides lentus]|uniref:Type II secretion system protein n=1 Tax=Nocardioides lentus TaxID=338077 RepID=A0ABN2P7S5_9ACTN